MDIWHVIFSLNSDFTYLVSIFCDFVLREKHTVTKKYKTLKNRMVTCK